MRHIFRKFLGKTKSGGKTVFEGRSGYKTEDPFLLSTAFLMSVPDDVNIKIFKFLEDNPDAVLTNEKVKELIEQSGVNTNE